MSTQFPKCKFCGGTHRLGPQWCPDLSSGGGSKPTEALQPPLPVRFRPPVPDGKVQSGHSRAVKRIGPPDEVPPKKRERGDKGRQTVAGRHAATDKSSASDGETGAYRASGRASNSKKGRPRIGEKPDKPWITAGMSERTYYRRQKEKSK